MNDMEPELEGDLKSTNGQSVRRRMTMRDVARVGGVSIQTVSNVINGRFEFMTPSTEARIRQVIEELGYRPNPAARGLRSSRTQTLALLVLDPAARFLADPMTDMFLAGLGDEMRERMYSLLIHGCKPGVPSDVLLQPLVEGRVDGAVVFLSGKPVLRRRYLTKAAEFRDRIILLQEHERMPSGVASVCAEDRAGSRALCRHLLASGHRRVGFLSAEDSWSAIEERLKGYRDAHHEVDLAVDESLVCRAGAFKPLDAARAARSSA